MAVFTTKEAIILTDLGGKASRNHVAHRTQDGFYQHELSRLTLTPTCIAPCGSLSDGYMEGALGIIEDAQKTLEGLQVPSKHHFVIGTAPLREAPNAQDFARLARDRGIPINVISGEAEARLIAEAAVMKLQETKPHLVDGNLIVFKLGGRSSEITLVKAGRIVQPVSIPYGAANRSHLRGGEESLRSIEQQVLVVSEGRPIQTLALCGGLMTGIGKLRAKVIGKGDSKIQRDEIKELQKLLSKASPRELSIGFRMPEEKANHLGYALDSISRLMDILDIQKARIPGTGLRHGVFRYHFTYGVDTLRAVISA